jgi:plastocyanin/uncharacterized membrane protein YozB (DUF420 family)
MNGRGFLGTDASLTADLSLVFGLAVATLLTIGVLLARQRRIGAHRTVQSSAVALNVLQVGVVMLGSFAKSVAPGLRDQLGDSYVAVAAGHGILGTVTLLFGVFVALRANELVPGFLRFHNYKLFMRTAYGLYMAATLAGVALYVNWYVNFSPSPTPREQEQPAVAAPTLAPAGLTTAPIQIVVVTATPLPTAAPATPTPVPTPAPRGIVAWHDDTQSNDALFVSAEGLPTDGKYGAWLTGSNGSLFLGPLGQRRGGGAQTLDYVSPEHANLLDGFDRLTVGTSARDSVVTGGVPAQALVHVRHILVGIPSTPGGIGFGIGLRAQSDELLRHAEFLQEALDDGNLPLEKLHAEHMINLIEGSHGEHYGDLNGNGRVENPGDGFGLLPNGPQDGYIKGMRDHAQLAAAAPDATADIKVHAGHVDIAGENALERVTEIRDSSVSILNARTVSATRSDVQRILALAHQTLAGVDLNGDEQIGPVPGEGGVLVAYQHAQLMASIPLLAEAPGAVSAPTLAPTVAPTVVASLPRTSVPTATLSLPVPTPSPTAVVRATAQTVDVAIRDNSFSPARVKVPVGSTVVWSQTGQRPHTVTADDESFATDVLKNGATFRQTFSSPGSYLYYCELHGGPGGVGMAARIDVEP